jgi:ribosomal protein L11 methyltransferase
MKTLVIDPGRAFGTGGHETTRLCLEFLDQCLEESPVDKVLDVGSGSGILTAAARLLGVPRVTALDIDPVAVEVTRENLRLNGVEDGTEVFCGNLFAVEGRYPLVVSNILYQILMGMAPELARRVLPGGRLILAGFLVQEAASAEALFTAQGLRVERRAEMGPWGAFVFRAPE